MSQTFAPTAIMVFTSRGPDRIIAEGGTQAWVLNPANARKHRYVVCVQNRHGGVWGNATEDHLTAFLIGKISAVEPAPNEFSADGRERYMIRVSQYARIKVAVEWQGRNPVRYVRLSEVGDGGIDLDRLTWEPMITSVQDSAASSDDDSDEPYAPEAVTGLVPEFRSRLAAQLGIDPAKIRIEFRIDP